MNVRSCTRSHRSRSRPAARSRTAAACVALLLGLAACGGGEGTGEPAEAGEAADLQRVEGGDAALELPRSVPAGSPFEVTWSGPDAEDDYLSVAERGSDDDAYVGFTYTHQGSPLTLRAPDAPGELEVRYVRAEDDSALVRAPLEVEPVEATLEARDTLMVNTPVEVRWSGPGNPDDYLAFAEQGSSGGSYATFTYTRQGSPLSLRTPEHPGRYELRYVMAQSDRVLTSRTVTVLPLQARLQAPDSVPAGREVEVSWLGPNGPDDFVALAAPDAPPGQYESRALTRAGDPAALFAPGAEGTYELRYVWAERDTVLARRPVVVTGS